jgi:glycosyltransferase involved in cell wall biosynthesis
MRIAILGLAATCYGNRTCLWNLLPQLAQLDQSNEYEVFLPPESIFELDLDQPNFHIHRSRAEPRSSLKRLLWEQLFLPWLLWAKGVDAVYTAHNLTLFLSPIPSVVVVHNIEPFFAGKFPNSLRLRARLWLLRLLTNLSLRKSWRIMAVSEWEREFLVERLHVPSDKIVTAYHGVTEGFRPPAKESAADLHECLGLERPYLLCVSRLAGYGNLGNLARAYASLVKRGSVTMPLVIAGGVWDSGYVRSVRRFLARQGCAEQVKFLGYVPFEHMPLLIGNADCFVFPSLLESCSNVLIEALACGTPVLCSQRRPMTDVCGDAAVFFDGEDPGDIADKLLQVLSDRSLRDTLARRGPARAARFSWRKVAEKLFGVLEQLNPTQDASNEAAELTHPKART